MSKKDSIVRVQKKDNYTVINNAVIKDDRLSWKARGILTYLLSLPNDWKVHLSEIEKHSPDGINSLRTGLKELKTHGYLERYPIKEKGKIIEWAFNVYEKPLNDFPHMEKPQVEKPHMENRTLLNTNNTNYLEELNTDSNKDIVEETIDYDSIKEYFNKTCTSLPKIRDLSETRKKKVKALVDKYGLDEFKTVINKTQASEFLSGRNGKWVNCGFDWIIEKRNFVKISEGNYDKEEKEVKKNEGSKPSNWITTDISQIDFSKNREVPWMSDDD